MTTQVKDSISLIIINDTSSACNKDIQEPHKLEKGKRRKTSSEEKPMDNPEPKRKKSIPKNLYIITSAESKSKEIVAKAMADMYKRMLNPV